MKIAIDMDNIRLGLSLYCLLMRIIVYYIIL